MACPIYRRFPPAGGADIGIQQFGHALLCDAVALAQAFQVFGCVAKLGRLNHHHHRLR